MVGSSELILAREPVRPAISELPSSNKGSLDGMRSPITFDKRTGHDRKLVDYFRSLMRAFAVHCGGFCRASVLYRSKTLTYSPQLVSSACLVCPDGSRRGAARYRTRTIKAPHGNPASPRPFRHTASPDLSVHLSNRHRQEKQHAREPGDLLHVLVSRSRPVREGHKPQCGHVRAGEVGLCRTTCEPAEQGRATFRGGWGGKGTD